MNLQLIGVNHRTAPVEVRERFAVSEKKLPEALQSLVNHPGISEGLIISTCNRVEILAGSKNGACRHRAVLAKYFRDRSADFEKYTYEFREKEAIKHLFRVTSSLDSMVVGEPQILGQVKEAYAVARAMGAVHSQIDALLTRSFAVAKKVRNETAIATSAVSVASVAVDWQRRSSASSMARRFTWWRRQNVRACCTTSALERCRNNLRSEPHVYRAVKLATKFNGGDSVRRTLRHR